MNEHSTNPYDKINELTRQDWQPLLDLIPQIEEETHFGRVESPTGQFPYYVAGELITQFFRIVHAMPIIIPFDWTSWKEGSKMINDPYYNFDTIDIPTHCKLITMIFRLDRFNEGTLGEAFESGLILRILKSIEKLVKPIPI